jgi:hypothetical protein
MSVSTQELLLAQERPLITEAQLGILGNTPNEYLDEVMGVAIAIQDGSEALPDKGNEDPKIVAGQILAQLGIQQFAETGEETVPVHVVGEDGMITTEQVVFAKEDFGTKRKSPEAVRIDTAEQTGKAGVPVDDLSETTTNPATASQEAEVKHSTQFELSKTEHDSLLTDLEGLMRIDPVAPNSVRDEAEAVYRDTLIVRNMELVLSPKSPTSEDFRILSLARDMGAAISRRVSAVAREQLYELIKTTKAVAPELAVTLLTSFINEGGETNGTVSAEKAVGNLDTILKIYEGADGGKKAQAVVLAIAYGASFKTQDGLLRRKAQEGLFALIETKPSS